MTRRQNFFFRHPLNTETFIQMIWMDMVHHRNLLSRTYDFTVFEKAVADIALIYLPAMEALHEFFVRESLQ